MLHIGCPEISIKHGVYILAYNCGKCSSQKVHKQNLKQNKLLRRDRGNVNLVVGIHFHIL